MIKAGVLLACYLIGSVPLAFIAGKALKGIDIRNYGSGNIGASNVLRTLGPGPAAAVFIGDTLKGLLAVLICQKVLGSPALAVIGGLMSILGHNFSLFLRFRGGKGVATSLGVVIGVSPVIAAITFGVWVATVAVCRYISVASILAAVSVPLQMWISGAVFHKPVPPPYLAFVIAAALFILVKHRSNIARLRKGCEPKIGEKTSI